MAMPQNSNVHMETMEATEDKAEKSDETWYSGVLCSHGGKQQERLLVHICNKYGQQSIIKRKTDTRWLLRFNQCISACACQLLKASYTERYARCCEMTVVSHRLLLDYWVQFYLTTIPFSTSSICFFMFSYVITACFTST